MFRKLKKDSPNPELLKQFQVKTTIENVRRLVILMAFIAATQILFMLLEASGVFPWFEEIFLYRIVIIGICALFTLLITLINRKISKSPEAAKLLYAILTLLFIIILASGCYFTIYMFELGSFSYSSLLLTAYILSLTCIRRPVIYVCFLLACFSGISVYTFLIVSELSINFISEYFITFVFVLMICIGSLLNYQRQWTLFLKEVNIKDINEKLIFISHTDELTGIYNRRKSMEDLEATISLAKRYNNDFCIAMLDIDHFKQINDKFGHNIGDNTLKSLSNFIKRQLRETDIFGRWGGEEFIIIAPHTDIKGAFAFIERLRKKTAAHTFKDVGNITFSAGLCAYSPGLSAFDMIDYADSALYESKEKGRNQTTIKNG